MADTKNPFGPTLKRIRENKGYTQQQIADHTMSRSTYTKFEANTIIPNVHKYLDILDHLDISHDEFTYILNDYQLPEKDCIWHTFIENMKHPSLELTKQVIKEAESFVDDRYDQLILSALNSARAYLLILEEEDLGSAKEQAAKVWEQLEKLDKWYLRELYLINSILYYFPIDTAVSFTHKALEELNHYPHFHEAKTLSMLYKFHLSSLLMMEEHYEEALEWINRLLKECHENASYLEWTFALCRKGACLRKISPASMDGDNLIEQAKQIFTLLEREDLLEEMSADPESFRNFYMTLQVSPV